MRYVFGDYSLDTQRYELRRAGELIPLGPQVFNVLTYLVAQRDRVVSRDELFARLWPRQFVTDDALGRCIRAARRALKDRPEAPRYIATTRGRGYRFIAPVQEQPHGLGEDGTSTTVPAQSIPRLPSVAGREGRSPGSQPTGSGERQPRSEELGQPAFAGEYKQVTVLCGGLVDAIALARRLGPEAMHRHMQTVFTMVQQLLHRYGGSLIEFSGEGFVALFGAPEAQEDHAQRAVLAALALHADVAASAPDLGQAPTEPLALCLGLHTGRVVVEHLGGDPPRLYTAVGETTQVALRLQQLAAPGTTLLSMATQHLVQEQVLSSHRGRSNLARRMRRCPYTVSRGSRASGRGSWATARGRAVPSWDGHGSWRCCRNASTRWWRDRGKSSQSWASPAWASRGCWRNSTAVWWGKRCGMWRDTVCPTAVPRRICRWWTWCASSVGSPWSVVRHDHGRRPPLAARGRPRLGGGRAAAPLPFGYTV